MSSQQANTAAPTDTAANNNIDQGEDTYPKTSHQL
jgi:hypothetical protein